MIAAETLCRHWDGDYLEVWVFCGSKLQLLKSSFGYKQSPKKHCQPNITEVSGFTFGSDEFNLESTFTFIWTQLDLKLVMVEISVYTLVVLRGNHPKIKICLETTFKRLHHPKIKICLKKCLHVSA